MCALLIVAPALTAKHCEHLLAAVANTANGPIRNRLALLSSPLPLRSCFCLLLILNFFKIDPALLITVLHLLFLTRARALPVKLRRIRQPPKCAGILLVAGRSGTDKNHGQEISRSLPDQLPPKDRFQIRLPVYKRRCRGAGPYPRDPATVDGAFSPNVRCPQMLFEEIHHAPADVDCVLRRPGRDDMSLSRIDRQLHRALQTA